MSRRRSSASDFINSFNDAYDTVNRVGKDFEIARVANAKPEELQIEQAGPTQDGSAMPTTTQYKVLGQTFTDKPTDEQLQQVRRGSQAAILEKYGDIKGADQLRQSAQQMALTGLQIKNAERQDKRETKLDERATKLEAIDTEYADWTKKRLTDQNGTTRDMTLDDQLAAGQYRVSRLAEAGMYKEANELAKDNMQFTKAKIEMQAAERNDAVGRTAAAIAAGDLGAAKEFYNKYIPDGAQVTDVVKDPKTGKITVERIGADGKPLPPHAFGSADELTAGLTMFKDPMALYNFSLNQFRKDLETRADKRADRQMTLAERSDARAGAAAAQGQTDRKAQANAAVALFKERNPKATAAEVDAVRRGILEPVPTADKNSPAEVKLANALVAAEGNPRLQAALKAAMAKGERTPREFYLEMMKPQSGIRPRESDVAPVMEAAYGPDWRTQINPNGAPSAADGAATPKPAAKAPAAGAIVNGYEFLGGDPKNQKNWRPVTTGKVR